MKERPILFSGAMVRAILAGEKTQTRRVVKPRKDLTFGCELAPHEIAGEVNDGDYSNCPYGQPGDRLWVRETFNRTNPDGTEGVYFYRADGHFPDSIGGHAFVGDESWKPSIFMPRLASRITLEITGVRVERLQDISEADVKAEGCKGEPCDHARQSCKDINCRGPVPTVSEYRYLWESINGKTAPWASNPWVWVIEFKRVA